MTTRRPWMAIAVLVLAAIGLRIACLDFETGDVHFWVVPWYANLFDHGFRALGREAPNLHGFEDRLGGYPPPYHYLLYVSTFFEGWAPRLHLVKFVSVAFDVLAAALMFGLVRFGTGSSQRAWGAFLAVLLAPTVIANGALWGQCDVVHTTFLLAAVFASVAGHPLLTVISVGIALSFKAQSVFLLPYLLLLVLGGRLRWAHLLAIPVAYMAMMMPAVLLGRPLRDVLMVYVDQGRFFSKLSMNAPNLYYFAPDEYYSVGLVLGTFVTIVASIAYAVAPRRRPTPMTPEFLVLAATVSVALAPFLLPKMHDRYFFPADILSIALAFYLPRLWFVPVTLQVSSMLSYIPVISDSLNNFDEEYLALMPVAALINTALVAYLVLLYRRRVAVTAAVADA